jgi:hypothetical protein
MKLGKSRCDDIVSGKAAAFAAPRPPDQAPDAGMQSPLPRDGKLDVHEDPPS